MKTKYHLLINTTVGFLLFVVGVVSFLFDHPIFQQSWSDIPGIFFAFIAALAWSDIDQHHALLPHRNWLTHSILIAIPFLFWWHFYTGVFIFFVGLHLCCDAIKDPDKQKGYWKIAITKNKRMNSVGSLIWLVGHGVTGLILGLMVMIL